MKKKANLLKPTNHAGCRSCASLHGVWGPADAAGEGKEAEESTSRLRSREKEGIVGVGARERVVAHAPALSFHEVLMLLETTLQLCGVLADLVDYSRQVVHDDPRATLDPDERGT